MGPPAARGRRVIRQAMCYHAFNGASRARLQGQHMADPQARLSRLSRGTRRRGLRLRHATPRPGDATRRHGPSSPPCSRMPDLRQPPRPRLLTAPLLPAQGVL
ncbi:hypothetical protein SCOCK_150163 [Actinacidiphila cocklensis]|uniref:Uncharacterized protein n=1 Tax=Actinacidiphila cocklensis TaxID=887465 RepID=A0A9W4DIV1_9ACTN|nr:hypothetical protein SCOCK_150163 [Actinacidiphila cocklensis]